MAKNTFKIQPVEKQPKPNRFTLWLARVLNIEGLVMGLPAHYLYYGIWMFFLTISYIYFSHKYENNIREIEKLKTEIDEKRSEYISKKASFMKETKKSEILKKVAPFGLEENLVAPQKIIVKSND
ncbi:MAG: FtsL-like putative cell division protein [Bacteroidota bacterium]